MTPTLKSTGVPKMGILLFASAVLVAVGCGASGENSLATESGSMSVDEYRAMQAEMEKKSAAEEFEASNE